MSDTSFVPTYSLHELKKEKEKKKKQEDENLLDKVCMHSALLCRLLHNVCSLRTIESTSINFFFVKSLVEVVEN